MQQDEPEPVLNVEALELHPLSRHWPDEDPIVGQHAVHVEAEQPDPPGGSRVDIAHTRALPQTSSV